MTPLKITRITGPGGREAIVSGPLSSGWDAEVRFPDGHRYRAPRYFASKSSAVAWAKREMGKGY